MEQSIRIDFAITSDPYYLTLTDRSNWAMIEGKPSIVEITLPGAGSPTTKYFEQYKVNNFHSNNLGVLCSPPCDGDRVTLPDGVYTVKVIGSPSNFCKKYYYLKTDMLEMDMAKAYITNFDKRDNQKVKNELFEAHWFLRGAEAEIKYENVNLASEYYQTALKIVERILNCKDCV